MAVILNKYQKDCYTQSFENKTQYIREWVNNSTTDTIIRVYAFPLFPHLAYPVPNNTHYKWCGPLLLLLQKFAQISNTRITIEKYGRTIPVEQEFETKGREGMTHLSLVPVGHFDYYNFWVSDKVKAYAPSSCLAYVYFDGILASTRLDADKVFKEFECFEPNVYYGIIASIIVISFISGLYKQSFLKSFFETFWTYSSVLLSDCYTIKMSESYDRLLAGIWQITCLLILSCFSGQLRDKIIRPKDIFWVDSWEDLYAWKHLKIQIYSGTDLFNYMKVFRNEPMAKNLMSRIMTNTTTIILYFDHHPKQDDPGFWDLEGVKAGNVAIVHNYDYIQKFKPFFQTNDFREGIDFHISADSLRTAFIALNKWHMNITMITKWNFAMDMIRESGIYGFLYKVGLNPYRLGPDFDDKLPVEPNETENISVTHMKGIFILYLVFIAISSVFFISEYYYKPMSPNDRPFTPRKRSNRMNYFY